MFRELIKRGWTLLDQTLGKGWWRRVRLRSLDLSNPECCVLGQLYRSYIDGKLVLGIEGFQDAELLGFDTTPSGYAQLTDEWKDALRNKRAGKSTT